MKYFILVLLYVLFLTSPILVYQTLRANAPARESWANDGVYSTTFVYRCQPFNVFSEDYHLYFIRAKRTIERGLFKDIFDSHQYDLPDLRNLIQFVICIPPVLTNGDPYKLFLCYYIYLIIAFWIFYKSLLVSQFRKFDSLLLAAIFFTILGTKFYRISTVLFSTPVMLYYLANLKSMYSRGTTDFRTFLLISVLSFILLNLDFWASLFTVFYGTAYLIFYLYTEAKLANKIKYTIIFISPLILFLVINLLVNNSDISIRAGISGYSKGLYITIKSFFSSFYYPYYLVSLFVSSILLLIFVKLRYLYLFAVAFLVPYFICFVMINFIGTESAQLLHLFYYQPVILIYLTFSFLHQSKIQLTFFNNTSLQKILVVFILVVSVFSGFFVRSTISFIYNNKQGLRGISSFANIRPIEKLKNTLHYYDLTDKSIFTLNFEVNYMLAFYTNANLILPSGFPLHSRKSNYEIIHQLVATSQLLGLEKEDLLHYILDQNDSYQTNWIDNRLKSERNGFAYNLLHRAAIKKSMIDSIFKKISISQEYKIDYIVYEPVLSDFLKKRGFCANWDEYSLVRVEEFKKKLIQ